MPTTRDTTATRLARRARTVSRRTPDAATDPMQRRLGRHTGPVGLNPYRAHRRRPADLLFVVSATVVAVALLAWAFLG